VNGTEFERTANVFDISFVPEDMEFDEDCHDEATEEVKGYKGNDFVTDVSTDPFCASKILARSHLAFAIRLYVIPMSN
jgi:hypothetical protein